MTEYQQIAKNIREVGFEAEVYYGNNKRLNKQLSYADKKNSPVAILLGEDELAKGVVTVRNLKLGKELSDTITDKKEWKERVQKEVELENLINHLKEIMK